MNLFILDTNPVLAAKGLANKHICKQVLESCQLLCNCFPEGTPGLPYKRTHFNHPVSMWVRECRGNFSWTLKNAEEISREYSRRYERIHKCAGVLRWININQGILSGLFRHSTSLMTPFVLCMPDKYKGGSAAQSYRSYYWHEKRHFAKWPSLMDIPFFWPHRTPDYVQT